MSFMETIRRQVYSEWHKNIRLDYEPFNECLEQIDEIINEMSNVELLELIDRSYATRE